MSTSIKFDNTEIVGTTYTPRFVKHESAPDRVISSFPIAREDGDAFIAERYSIKRIILQGVITGSTQAVLEAAIDTMKELFSRPEKNLDIDWNSSTRRYVASCIKHDFDRDHYNIAFCPWTAEFEVLSGEGKDTATTTALNAHVVTVTTPGSDSFDMAGSKPAKPTINLKIGSTTTKVKGIEYKDTDTGEKIVFTSSKATWFQDDHIIFDCLLKKVTENIASAIYNERKFYGVFPRFIIGTNNVLISAGGLVNQSTGDTATGDSTTGEVLDATTERKAQSFKVPYTDDTFKGITLMLTKTGNPGNMTVRIETDSGGKPSGSLVDANATFTITAASVSTKGYYTVYSAGGLFPLTANTKYWIVISAAATLDGSNYYTIAGVTSGSGFEYPNGKATISTDSGATYSDWGDPDFVFRILYGGEPDTESVAHTVTYTKTYL